MFNKIMFETCEKCNRGYNLTNPLVEIAGLNAMKCPHCGQKTTVDAETMKKARAERGITDDDAGQ